MYAAIHMRALDPVLTEWAAPRSSERGVAIAASAGGIPALIAMLRAHERPFAFPIFVVQHISRDKASLLARALRWHSQHAIEWAEHGSRPRAGIVYLCPPAFSMRVSTAGFELVPLAASSASWLPCPDLLFESVAETYKSGAVGIVLSGMMAVALKGLHAIRAQGGITIAQSQGSASHGEMPGAAVDFGKADIALPPALIAEALATLDQEPGIAPAAVRVLSPPPRDPARRRARPSAA
ncbi:MAG TPA: chemotaxis protein CheB [Stellaceae bacterium]|nr:chemotaxis protein CheB [Stellaceae bacterium]